MAKLSETEKAWMSGFETKAMTTEKEEMEKRLGEWRERALKAEGALAKAQAALMEISQGLEKAEEMLEEMKNVL